MCIVGWFGSYFVSHHHNDSDFSKNLCFIQNQHRPSTTCNWFFWKKYKAQTTFVNRDCYLFECNCRLFLVIKRFCGCFWWVCLLFNFFPKFAKCWYLFLLLAEIVCFIFRILLKLFVLFCFFGLVWLFSLFSVNLSSKLYLFSACFARLVVFVFVARQCQQQQQINWRVRRFLFLL